MTGRDYYFWQVQSFTIRLALDVVDRLNAALLDSRRSHDEEHGGILLGRVIGPNQAQVTGFEFVQSEHRRGIAYDLGLLERQRVTRHVLSLRRSRGEMPVGYFRTHMRPGLFLDQDDFLLMKEAFAEPSSVALLINTVQPGISSAGFFYWSGDDIDRKQSKLQFPFDSASLRASGAVRTEQIAAPVTARTPLNVPPWQALTAASLAAIAGFGIVSASTRNSGKSARELAPVAVTQPARPAAAAPVSESANPLAGGNRQDAGNAQNSPSDGSIDQPVRPVYVPEETGGVIAAPAPYTPPVSVPPPAPESTTPHAQSPVAVAPVQQPAAAASNQPPATTPAAASVQEASHAEEPAPIPAPLPVRRRPAVLVAVSMEPRESSQTRGSELKKFMGHVPLVGHVLKFGRSASSHSDLAANFQPARPNSALKPRVPQEMAASLWHELPVDVKVSIDKNGVVRNTEVLSGGHTTFSSLAADNAFWTAWQPARIGEQTVPSEVILHYRFRPTSPGPQ